MNSISFWGSFLLEWYAIQSSGHQHTESVNLHSHHVKAQNEETAPRFHPDFSHYHIYLYSPCKYVHQASPLGSSSSDDNATPQALATFLALTCKASSSTLIVNNFCVSNSSSKALISKARLGCILRTLGCNSEVTISCCWIGEAALRT